MGNKAYIDFLIERDKVKSPYKDKACLNNNGKPITRCPVCHYILNLFTEQFCPTCGQRFVDSKNDKFYEERNKVKKDAVL